MNRMIYCPNEGMLEKAISMSKINLLPILIGDNEHTRKINFNRDDVCSISVPEYKGYDILTSVSVGFHQNVKYCNEFRILKNNIKLLVNNNQIKSLYQEKHFAKFIFKCEKSGNYECKILVNDEIEEEFSFVVN